jgi:endonuclease/exonuclease/phosphatase family metal-dependent hydrolase
MPATWVRSIVVVAMLVSLWTGAGWAQAPRVAGFNVESGGARPDVVDDFIAAAQGVELWGFSEVQNAIWATLFAQAAAQGETGAFAPILGTSGGGDRLLIVYHQERFDLIRSFELTDSNIGGNVRAPLVAHFRLKPAGPEFLFMVNHLHRSRTERRHEQARLFNAWARQQTLPVIAVDDYNFDWGVRHGETVHDPGYDHLTVDSVFTWVRPPQLIRTQCSFDSVLDFVFVAGAARQWRAASEILAAEESYCPSNQSRSDHRPVLALFELGADGQPSPRQRLLAQLQRMEADFSALRSMVEQMSL